MLFTASLVSVLGYHEFHVAKSMLHMC